MFKPNVQHLQNSLFGFQNTLPESMKKELFNSEEYYFYEIVFCNIKEEYFSVLYSDQASRPNAAINCLVGAIILKQKKNWTYDELFYRIKFDLLTKTALGLDRIDYEPFDESTMYNFQNRLLKYEVETGINLLEQVFDNLTKTQLSKLKIKTDIQRSDSLMASSNIRSYSRLQLLIEVLLRFWRVLSEADKSKFKAHFLGYTNNSSGQYIYKLKSRDLPHELNRISELYQFIKINILPQYSQHEIAAKFERVYNEHFTEVSDKIEVKKSTELNSSCLQSPDDIDATFREKRKEEYKGQSINITETASPDNPINLLTDVSVNPNNVDDSVVLNKRIAPIMEKTPDLNELHTDGAYGSEANDKRFAELGIMHIETAVRGRQSEVEFIIDSDVAGKYNVSCPKQSAVSEPTHKRHKCIYDKAICQQCEFAEKCPTVENKSCRTYYFTHEDYLRNKRHRNYKLIPLERRKLRPNVEASVHEFTYRMPNKKLKVRGALKTEIFAFSTAIAINFGRIFRYMRKMHPNNPFFLLNLVVFVKKHLNFVRILAKYQFSANQHIKVA